MLTLQKQINLFPKQREDVAKLRKSLDERHVGLCFLDTGGGKSLEALYTLSTTPGVRKIWIINKANLSWQWYVEYCKEYLPMKFLFYEGPPARRAKRIDYPYLLMSYEIFRNDIDMLKKQINYNDFIIFDEATHIKGYRSPKNVSQICQAVLSLFDLRHPYMFFMTGTPVTNRPNDCYIFFRLYHGERYKFYSHDNKYNRYKTIKDKNGKFKFRLHLGTKNIPLLKRELKKIAVHRTVAEIEKVKVNQTKHMLKMDDYHKGLYLQFKKNHYVEIDGEFIHGKGFRPSYMKARQLASDPGTLAGKWSDIKIAKTIELIEEIDNTVIVAATFIKTVERLYGAIQATGRTTGLMYGKVSRKMKNIVQDDFKAGRADVLLGHPKSIAYGFNFQFVCRHIIIAEIMDDYELLKQLIARVRRVGGSKEVFVHYLLTAKTMEQKVYKVLTKRGNMVNYLKRDEGRLWEVM